MTDTQVMAALEPCICTGKGWPTEDGHAIDCPVSINYAAYKARSTPAHPCIAHSPAAEPVGWMYDNGKHDPVVRRTREPYLTQIGYAETPLYAAPVPPPAGDAELRKALEPFAKEAKGWDADENGGAYYPDNESISGENNLKVGHLRAARRALAAPPSVPAQQGEG